METIYTIPINEAFEHAMEAKKAGQCECPFCALASRLENDELDRILGASMMEPDIRIKTNEMGFCRAHFEKMMKRPKRLPLALMLESHTRALYDTLTRRGPLGASPEKNRKRLSRLAEECYVCERVEGNMKRMMANAVYMWQNDAAFAAKVRAQNGLCLTHLTALLNVGAESLNKKRFESFYTDFATPSLAYLETLCEDVSQFCRSFDYRFGDEPLGRAKDAVERSVAHLSGREIPVRDNKRGE